MRKATAKKATVLQFANDLTTYPVQIVMSDGQTLARGLPITRPGIWNGETLTVPDMQQIADNFVLRRDVEGIEPALKDRHSYDADGNRISLPADTVQAWWKLLWFDQEAQVLFGDCLVVDYGMECGMRSGQLRYLSSEIASGYELMDQASGESKDIGKVLVGAAWVDDPAVTGLGWELVVNRADYQVRPMKRDATRTSSANARTTSAQKGGNSMNWFDRLKAVLSKAGVAEEDLAELGEPDVMANATAGEPDALATLRAEHMAQLAERDKRIGELETRVATVAVNARAEKVMALVDMRVRGGIVAPAQREAIIALAMALPEEAKIKIFAADGKTAVETPALDAYFATLDAQGPKVSTHARGLSWVGNEDPNAEPEAMDDGALTAVAAQAK
jgi:hypothetical protein